MAESSGKRLLFGQIVRTGDEVPSVLRPLALQANQRRKPKVISQLGSKAISGTGGKFAFGITPMQRQPTS